MPRPFRSTVEERERCLDQIDRHPCSELWLATQEGGPFLSMLVNGPSAWLMYQSGQDDPGCHTVNPAYRGPACLYLDFQLSNGQLDMYPATWTLPLEEAFAACTFFVLTQGKRSPAPCWEDS